MPYSGDMKSTITENSDQMEKPMCSQMIDQTRLRLAISAPPASQACRSSGSHPVMWCLRV
ncbi:Uncharacterised protein [Mycobacteroides abscessus subsp. abscessus]|nr:Uncharacterised protein [Mycobacteroides abscessus subsp. abscessus]